VPPQARKIGPCARRSVAILDPVDTFQMDSLMKLFNREANINGCNKKEIVSSHT
jgi:hypothetical protein